MAISVWTNIKPDVFEEMDRFRNESFSSALDMLDATPTNEYHSLMSS